MSTTADGLAPTGDATLAPGADDEQPDYLRAGYRWARPDLRKRRTDRGVSVQAIACEAGVDPRTIYSVEARKRRASPATQAAYTHLLSTAAVELFEPDAVLQSVLGRYEAGDAIAAIADDLGCDWRKVKRWLLAENVPIDRERHQRRRVCLEAVNGGPADLVAPGAAAGRVGIDARNLRRWIKYGHLRDYGEPGRSRVSLEEAQRLADWWRNSVSATEAREIIGIGADLLALLLAAGEIPHRRFGPVLRLDGDVVQALAEERAAWITMTEITKTYGSGLQYDQLMRYHARAELRFHRAREVGLVHVRSGQYDALIVRRVELDAFFDSLGDACPHCGKPLRRGFVLHQGCGPRSHIREPLEQLKASEEAMEVGEAAGRLVLDPSTVYYLIRNNVLPGKWHQLRGFAVLLIKRADLDRLERQWALDLDENPQRRRWLNEDKAVELHRTRGHLELIATRRGMTVDEVEDIVRGRVRRRRERLMKRRRGRRAPTEPAAWAAELAATFDDLERDLEVGLRDRPPSKTEAAIDVARRHPEWLPAHYQLPSGALDSRLERQAADTILKAVRGQKPLQTVRKK